MLGQPRQQQRKLDFKLLREQALREKHDRAVARRDAVLAERIAKRESGANSASAAPPKDAVTVRDVQYMTGASWADMCDSDSEEDDVQSDGLGDPDADLQDIEQFYSDSQAGSDDDDDSREDNNKTVSLLTSIPKQAKPKTKSNAPLTKKEKERLAQQELEDLDALLADAGMVAEQQQQQQQQQLQSSQQSVSRKKKTNKVKDAAEALGEDSASGAAASAAAAAAAVDGSQQAQSPEQPEPEALTPEEAQEQAKKLAARKKKSGGGSSTPAAPPAAALAEAKRKAEAKKSAQKTATSKMKFKRF